MQRQTGPGILSGILSAILALAIFGAIGALAYTIAVPPITERFTEFYLLGMGGKAEGYPQNLAVGEEGSVILGITNREHETASYRVEVTINQTRIDEISPIVLKQAETWQETVNFRPTVAGESQKVEFLLYRTGRSEVYRSVYILINVR